jgi:hypothetical protein
VRIPSIFVAYASSGPGLCCAVVYLGAERDVYGWYVYRDDPDAAAELEACAKAEPATGEVNLRFLARRCPLEYHFDLAEAA